MSTWYSVVKVFERFDGSRVVRRKVELDGWKDRPEVAYYAIGQGSDARRDLDEFYKDYDEFVKDIGELDSNVSLFADGVSSLAEEWVCGVATSKEKAKEYYVMAEEESPTEDEW